MTLRHPEVVDDRGHLPARIARLVDGGVSVTDLPAAAVRPGAQGRCQVQVTCRPIWAPTDSPESMPKRVGRAIDVLLYPSPTIGGPDLSGADLLTALALAVGARPIERPGWAVALALPGTAWVIGRPEAPAVAYGLGACEARAPAEPDEKASWRAAQVQRVADVAARELSSEAAEALVAIVTRDVGLLEDSHQPRDQR